MPSLDTEMREICRNNSTFDFSNTKNHTMDIGSNKKAFLFLNSHVQPMKMTGNALPIQNHIAQILVYNVSKILQWMSDQTCNSSSKYKICRSTQTYKMSYNVMRSCSEVIIYHLYVCKYSGPSLQRQYLSPSFLMLY